MAPGELHVEGCSVEQCALCGGQTIACECVYLLSGLDPLDMEETHPEVFTKGPTPAMQARYDAEVRRAGGRLPWEGEFPGSADCRRLGLWCRWVEGRDDRQWLRGWVQCEADHPEATEGLNELRRVAHWDRQSRRWEKS